MTKFILFGLVYCITIGICLAESPIQQYNNQNGYQINRPNQPLRLPLQNNNNLRVLQSQRYNAPLQTYGAPSVPPQYQPPQYQPPQYQPPQYQPPQYEPPTGQEIPSSNLPETEIENNDEDDSVISVANASDQNNEQNSKLIQNNELQEDSIETNLDLSGATLLQYPNALQYYTLSQPQLFSRLQLQPAVLNPIQKLVQIQPILQTQSFAQNVKSKLKIKSKTPSKLQLTPTVLQPILQPAVQQTVLQPAILSKLQAYPSQYFGTYPTSGAIQLISPDQQQYSFSAQTLSI